jgi:hypothetical protein
VCVLTICMHVCVCECGLRDVTSCFVRASYASLGFGVEVCVNAFEC